MIKSYQIHIEDALAAPLVNILIYIKRNLANCTSIKPTTFEFVKENIYIDTIKMSNQF